jgi:hypothetical protein
MSSASTNRPHTSARFGRAGSILARLGFGAFAGPLAAAEVTLDHAYHGSFAGSGGKFTDSLEREADLRVRESSAAF